MSGDGDSRRVVVVVSQLGFGGAERQTLDLLRQLRPTPWAPVRVICLSTKASAHEDAVRALGYPLSIVRRSAGFDVGRSFALHRLLRRDGAEVVHAVNWLATGYAVLAKPRGARIISSIRNSHLPAGRLRRFALTRLVRRAHRVVVNSDRGRQLLVHTCGVAPTRVAVVPNGIDVDQLRRAAVPGALRRELGIAPDVPIVAYVGRNARVKNIPRLLGVVRSLLQANPALRIVVAGEGLDASLVAGGELANEPRLHCLGPRRDIASLLCDVTVLVLTSDHEGMPNVVFEALASGVPVVATDVGDVARMLPPNCGVLVPPDSEQLAAATLRVIAEAAAYRRAVEAHATLLAATYSSSAMANRTVNIWREVSRRVDRRAADSLTRPRVDVQSRTDAR